VKIDEINQGGNSKWGAIKSRNMRGMLYAVTSAKMFGSINRPRIKPVRGNIYVGGQNCVKLNDINQGEE
jgi:hypothetical protein